MRNKIIVDIINSEHPKDADLVYENGQYFIVRLKEDEIHFLFSCGFFDEISEKFDLYFIDYYEHEIICEQKKIEGIREVAYRYRSKNSLYDSLFIDIIRALDIAIEKKSCFSIIL